ncbi:hypothetical protein F4810DRAFT_539813 [Camillea tinctor]|nr:hypothetical protein F4810DRAFT_539813 [Camillea tinctor]
MIKTLAIDTLRQRQHATISFKLTPENIKPGTSLTLDLPECNDIGLSKRQKMTVDSQFTGFAVLDSPFPDKHAVEYVSIHPFSFLTNESSIVAISGPGSHAYGSPKERGGAHMWLSDSLPFDLQTARIITYGYDSGHAKKDSFQSQDDLADLSLSAAEPENHMII